MKRRAAIIALGIVLLAGATVAARPLWMKWRARARLEEAASNACACMLGRHGDVDTSLLAVRAGIIAKPNAPDRLWPRRCQPWGEAAQAAWADAARWNVVWAPAEETWDSPSFLQALTSFWVRDPDPRVPIPELGSFELTEGKLAPFVDGDALDLRIASDKLEINEALAIDRDDHVERMEHDTPVFAGRSNWRAIDAEAGAKRYWTDGALFYDDAGHALGKDWFTSLVFARSFRDGRLVAHVYVSTLEESRGEIWEYAPNHALTRAPLERNAAFNAKSTTVIDEWMLYKQVEVHGGSITAIDFSRGAAAKPIVLGPVDKTSRALGRSYGTCRAHQTFVDMDPSFLIRAGDGWTFAGLQQSIHRIVSCEGDVAMVTEWFPLEIRKCTREGCTLVAFPGLSTGADDELAADEQHLFQLVRDDGAVGVHVYALANPSDARHVPVLDQARDARLRVVAGRAIVLVRTKRGGEWSAISVRPDGKVHAITAM